jgi:hypothetical protein
VGWKEEQQANATDSRTSGRKRKQPVTRGDDFLWTAALMKRMWCQQWFAVIKNVKIPN